MLRTEVLHDIFVLKILEQLYFRFECGEHAFFAVLIGP